MIIVQKSFGMGATVDLLAAGSTVGVTEVTGGDNSKLVHGAVSAVFVGLLMPLAMILARSFKEYNPAWFHLHRIIGSLAFLGAIAGVALGFRLTQIGKLATLHQGIGIAVMALAALQVSSLMLRPGRVSEG